MIASMPEQAPRGTSALTASSDTLLRIEHISKSFPGVQALNDVSFHLGQGEVLAVIGENGAGKSTLMKILAGIQSPDEGSIQVNGKPVHIHSVEDAFEQGIVLIHQELNLADNLDVGANVYLGREPTWCGLIDNRLIQRETSKFLEMVGLNISPKTPLKSLTTGQQQLVEIAKALSINSRVLIMDEPTSSLSHHETVRLFEVVKKLRDQGVSIIYISHRLGEVEELADRVVVLRDGNFAGELSKADIRRENMVPLMVGRELDNFYERSPHPKGEVVLEANRLVTTTYPGSEVSFSLSAGEIVGIAGLVGAGRTELLRVLFGIDQPLSGTISVHGHKLHPTHPLDAIQAGIALVPEDRKAQGLILEMTVRENASLPSLITNSGWLGWLRKRWERELAENSIQQQQIKTPSADQVAQYLSGGNQQKIVFAKWLATNPKILLLDEPTRGIDVGAKHEMYALMDRLASEGLAVLFVSSEMDEILGMSDRVLVMHEGRLTGELSREELSEEAVMHLATGG